jgi:hypothetical protein
MKFINYLFTGLILGGIMMASVGTSYAADGTIPAKVVRVKGDARYTTDNTTWHTLKVGQTLEPGTTIQTGGNDSMVDVILGDGEVEQNPQPLSSSVNFQPEAQQNLVRIWADTTLGIDKLTQMQMGSETMTDTQLDLRAGSVFGTVLKLSPTSKYEVKVPNGVAGIRGTIYSISATGVVAVLQGSVIVAYIDASGNPATKQVDKGYEFDTRTGQITPLSQLNLGQLIKLAWESRIIVNRPVTVTTDHTIYQVSPVDNHNNH